MARINGKYIQGALGPAVFKKQDGKQIIVSKVRKGEVIQSAKTKQCSKTFGSASRLVRLIRNCFSDLSNGFEDGGFNSRLISSVSDTLYDAKDASGYTFSEYSFEGLSGMEFNSNSPLLKTLRIKPIVELSGESLSIALPELKISKHFIFPVKSTDCKITVSIYLYRLKERRMNRNRIEESLTVNHNQIVLPPQNFSFKIPEGCLCVAGLFLQFYHSSEEFKILDNDKNFNPSSIVASIYRPGTFNRPEEKEWTHMFGFEWK